MSAAPNAAASPLAVTRIALVGLDAMTQTVLRDLLGQFSVETVALDSAEAVDTQKVEGCAIHLDRPDATAILDAIRKSPRNRHVVLYGLYSNPKVAARFSRYGINVLLPVPVDRASVAKAFRSTRLLLLHELRRYVRIPLAIEVVLDYPQGRLNTTSVEVSGGGMSLNVPETMRAPRSTYLRASFTLPDCTKTSLGASVCWRNEAAGLMGIRFDPAEKDGEKVRKWVDEYLRLHEQV